jgi:hypothetical protein
MKGILALMLRTVGIKKLVGLVWELADEQLKNYVKKSDNPYDDETLVVVEHFIQDWIKA